MANDISLACLAIAARADFQAIKRELVAMSQNCTVPCPERCVYLGEAQPRVRELGERLNELGGFVAMALACQAVPSLDQRELDYAWNGIGTWMA